MKERFRDVPGYEGLYQVSNLGAVKSFFWHNKPKERLIKPTEGLRGYLVVGLTKNKTHKIFGIHRLVALTFLKNPKNLPQVNHIDHNHKNNHVSNLEWITHSDNIKHSYTNPLRGHPNRYIYFKRKYY